MFVTENYTGTLQEKYTTVTKQLDALLHGETDTIANLSNASALLNVFLPTINWVGFYLFKDGELVLGPFQGLPACVRIPLGRGVCGTAAVTKETQRVDDVHAFPGHIACDAASQSEIVIPIFKNNELVGVLDIDSPIKERFSEEEAVLLERFVRQLENHL